MTQVVIPPGTETDPVTDVSTGIADGGRVQVYTPFPDRGVGTSGADQISALAGDDIVASGGGNDVVALGEGEDTGVGGTGNDSIQGNRGNDSIQGGDGDDCLRGGRDNDTLEGGEGEDIIFSDRGDDVARGGSGDDDIRGNQGNDFLEGNEGNDIIDGGKGNDTLDGGAGDDFISGARDNDILTGGAGADDFFFWYNSNGSYGVDTLTDFNRGEGDKIVLAASPFIPENARFNALTGTPNGDPLPADQFAVIENFNPVVDGASSAAIVYDPTNGLVYYNPTGSVGDENQFAKVDETVYDGNNPLQNTDFEIF
ncbi:calcium-binding protein [Okeania sp. SIO1F9]|uniref:calcium-binding protein n=1 Tax=Okeania sp. SIO1F9 TaxID=2607813 RepID=UPI00144D6C68|nr:calcium-binding protein [Okeania sp. SIO1F9]NET77808.1 calcium-binding protein [Okeania sp. SIO1F9]